MPNDDFGFFWIFGAWMGEESNLFFAVMETKWIAHERRTAHAL
jgi:hypothetical protein